jgi:hypothetical protein
VSGEEDGSGRAPEAVPGPAAAPAPEHRAANVLGGIVLIVGGLCMLFLGGGCTVLMIYVVLQSHGSGLGGVLPMLLVSLALAAAGLFAIVFGIRVAGGRTGR